MIPKDLIKKVRLIELRTRKLVDETMAGQYHSNFRGQGMDFDEVREYQPGDEVRAIDWNVTARMNHPFVKKFREERELTVLLMVDISASGLFGSGSMSKRELAAEIACVLAFAAIRNQDRVGLLLFSEEVEKFIPPRKGRRHAMRVVRDILGHEPKQRGTSLNGALDFATRVLPHRAILVVLSDFLAETKTTRREIEAHPRRRTVLNEGLGRPSQALLRQASRRHDVVAIQISDPFEIALPALGRLVLQDAETGDLVEINTNDERRRLAFAKRQEKNQADLERLFRQAKVDALRLRTDEPYDKALAAFFETRERRHRHG
jgi:uncharacterized protein (DUF58 family)